MKHWKCIAAISAAVALAAEPASAHHVMGGGTPGTVLDGVLSGLGHPVIGLDHFAAVIAIGFLAAVHGAGAWLAAGYVLAMIGGAALHVLGADVPAGEILVALSVVLLGATLIRRRSLSAHAALILFAVVGAIHGYALGESVTGAEPAPLAAYFIGLAVVQSAVALSAMTAARALMRRTADPTALRLTGAAIAGIGLAIFAQHVTGA